jgi:guanine nucleotide exchange protein RalF
LNKSEQLAELFLQENAQLNLDHVGDYLSGPDDEHKNTLKYFTSKMDFKDKSFIPAMREYLKTFKLPGEGQKIDRVVEAFGARYYDQNPNKDGIANKDAAYILAYQVIMLNSDLHKPASKDKMSLDDLKRNLRGLNEQNDFSKELLTHIYDDIQANPFEFNFVEIPPKYVLSGKELSSNKTFSQLDSCFSVGNFEVTDIFPELKNDNASYAVNISHPKSFLNRFLG